MRTVKIFPRDNSGPITFKCSDETMVRINANSTIITFEDRNRDLGESTCIYGMFNVSDIIGCVVEFS